MFTCNLCNRDFNFKSKLEEHKKRKTSCVKIDDEKKCKICNLEFSHKSNRISHEKTKKHISNITNIINGDVHNGDNITNNINNIINLTINMNPFSETDLSNIRPSLIRSIAYETYSEFLDETIERLNNRKVNLVFGCFSGLIKVFKHTNFNVAFSDNFNFKILLLFNCSKKLFEYLILEKNIKTNTFEWKQIGYDDFLGEFVYLMNLISKKINCSNFTKILNYLKKNLIDDDDMKILLKPQIENELDEMYNKFRKENNLKPREFGDDNDNIKVKMEYYNIFRKNECRFDNGFDPKITNSII